MFGICSTRNVKALNEACCDDGRVLNQNASAQMQVKSGAVGSSTALQNHRLPKLPTATHADRQVDSLVWLSPLPKETSCSNEQDWLAEAPRLASEDNFGIHDTMMTQTSLLGLPRNNELHDLAFFLKMTGPPMPHKKLNRVGNHQRRVMSVPRNALRVLKRGSQPKPPEAAVEQTHTSMTLRDEGGLLSKFPAEQKISCAGKRYLALQVPQVTLKYPVAQTRPTSTALAPDILELGVSDCVQQGVSQSKKILRSRTDNVDIQQDLECTESLEQICEPRSSIEGCQGNVYHLPTSKISLPGEESPVRHPRADKEIDIQQPLPRRLGTHPVLLQRASTLACVEEARADVQETTRPPPPPRNALRLMRQPSSVEDKHGTSSYDPRMTSKTVPSIASTSEPDLSLKPFRAIVTTECTGPIKPSTSRKIDANPKRARPRDRKEQYSRKDTNPTPNRPFYDLKLDPIVSSTAPGYRRPQRRERPLVSIKSPWQCMPPTSHVAFGDGGEESEEDEVGPIPASSPDSGRSQNTFFLGPGTFVAETVSLPSARATAKPSRLILREGKTYAPRPRSALVSHALMKQRPCASQRHSKDVSSDMRAQSGRSDLDYHRRVSHAVPISPPTPPASGSERTRKINSGARSNDEVRLNAAATSQDAAQPGYNGWRGKRMPHIVTQQRRSAPRSSRRLPGSNSQLDDRLKALERQNACLSAALMAVLKTTDDWEIESALSDHGQSRIPMAWESRVARRSAATSCNANGSNDHALGVYMQNRGDC